MIRIAGIFSFVLFFIFLLPFAYGQCPEGYTTGKENIIVNGNFEQGNIGFFSEYHYRIGYAEVYPGDYSVTDNPNFSNPYFLGKGKGKMLAVDGSPHKNKAAWKQDLKVKPNAFYVFSVHTANLSQTGLSAILRLNINGVSYPLTIPNKPYSWLRNSLKWNSGSTTEAVIFIKDYLVSNYGNDFALDEIKLCECFPIEAPPIQDKRKVQNTLPQPIKERPKEPTLTEPRGNDSLELVLNKTNVGEKIKLRHIIFDQGKSFLKSTSFKALDQLANYLIKYPRIEIEISGHTDNQGDASLNLELSIDRIYAVKEYLVSKGISSNKIICKGYGGTRPIAKNDIEETRKLNRRVEIKILKK